MLKFDENYFAPQVVDNFYVRPMIKRGWAAQLEVLEEIKKICKRHDIKYYAEWGTLLGAIRHKGYVPWDDDLDIGMFREDYEKFCYYAKQELPEGLSLLSIHEQVEFDEMLGRVVNTWEINLRPEFMEKYHGCPYSVGVDIFVTDYVPRKKEDRDLQVQLLLIICGLAKIWDDPKENEEDKWASLQQISEMTGHQFDLSKSIPNQLYLLTEQVSKMYHEDEADDVALIVLLTYEDRYQIPKSCYSSLIEVPFENTTIPVPVDYDRVLRSRYGANYMTPVKRWGTHDYPAFKEQEKQLVNLFYESNLPIPPQLDVMPDVEQDRYLGLQYHALLSKEDVLQAGIQNLELSIEDLGKYREAGFAYMPKGIRVTAGMLLQLGVPTVVESVLAMKSDYLVIDTTDFWDIEALDEALTAEIETFRWKPLLCFIENGYARNGYGEIIRNPYSEVAWLNETVDAYNMLCGRDCFGICLNVGHANVLSDNLRAFAEAAGERLGLIHMNDNDGNLDMHQMPFTFTNGRGSRNTDIYRLIGTLVRMDYQGGIVFDVSGFWEKAPVPMQRPALRLLQALGKEWEEQFCLKEKLSQEDKKIILFGTGAMAYNYIVNWAQDYPPYRMVDNNQDKWGQEFFGVPIVSPETILEIPPEERNVFICNMYYSQISAQLEQMGVDYDIYNDNYYM